MFWQKIAIAESSLQDLQESEKSLTSDSETLKILQSQISYIITKHFKGKCSRRKASINILLVNWLNKVFLIELQIKKKNNYILA